MQITLVDADEFTKVNHLKPVTSPVLFSRGDQPNPQGLLSLDIFGMTPKDRKDTFAYIDLGQRFFHPHVYKIIKRFFRNVENIVNGTEYYTIDSNGYLAKADEETGQTGIQFLYDNWEKIKFEEGDSTARSERIDVVTRSKKSEVFLDKELVIPAFYRDNASSASGGGKTLELNTMYSKLIRISSILRDRDSFGFPLYQTQAIVQDLLVTIYDYFKDKLGSKNGLIRRYLMGKNVDYCTRSVITATSFHANSPSDLMVNMRYSGVPVAQVLSLCQPFIVRWVKEFINREIIQNQSKDVLVGSSITDMELDNPQAVFTDKFILKKMEAFIKDPECRFDKIEVPLKGKKKAYLAFKGRRYNKNSTDELATIATRPMTWTDLFYMASEDAVEDKHILITRYPLLDQYGLFATRIRTLSTTTTMPMQVGDKIYRWYPVIDFDVPRNQINTKFMDSVQFSNSYLPGIDGDFDGDQVTDKILWLQESNKELEDLMNQKQYFINTGGSLIRKVEVEVIQTFFNMTKNTTTNFRTISAGEKAELLGLAPEDLTFDVLVQFFGIMTDPITKKDRCRFHPEDKMTLAAGEWYGKNKAPIDTTVGRYLFNKILLGRPGFQDAIPYVNDEVTEGYFFKKVEGAIANALLHDKIKVDQMYEYVDTRDWLGMQLHALITPSFTPETFKINPEVQKLKDELFEKHKDAIESGDTLIVSDIEKQLIAKTKEVLKGDPGMDLYDSGARGSIANNYKNMFIMRGSVYNRSKKKYEIVKNSLADTLAIKDIPVSSNTILEGAYPESNLGPYTVRYNGKLL